jgi:hypothetical protein
LRPLLRIYSVSNVFYTSLSFKYFTIFWLELIVMLVNFIKYNLLRF